MARMVPRIALLGLAAGLFALLPASARAEVLVVQFRQDAAVPNFAAVTEFGVAPLIAAPTTPGQPEDSRAEEADTSPHEEFLRQQGVELTTLFFGYFGKFLPKTNPPGKEPPPDAPPKTPPTNNPPTTNPPPTQPAPEPATLLSGLFGVGIAGWYAWRRRRKRAATD